MEALELARTYRAEVQQTRAVNMLQQAQIDDLREQLELQRQEMAELRMMMILQRDRIAAVAPPQVIEILDEDEETVAETVEEVAAEDGPVNWEEGEGWDEVVIQQSGLLVEIMSGEDSDFESRRSSPAPQLDIMIPLTVDGELHPSFFERVSSPEA